MINRRAFAIDTIRVLLLTTLLLCGSNVTPRGRINSSYKNSLRLRAAPAVVPAAQVSGNGLIAFSADEQIYIMDAGGGPATRLTNSPPFVLNRYPAFSPDGSRLAFTRDDNNQSDHALYLMDLDGSNLQRLTTSSVALGEPSWSPDGSKIAFVRGYDMTYGGEANSTSCGQEIYVIDLVMGLEMNLTHGEGGTDPTWSPDGTQIAFSSARNDSYDIYKMAADGSMVKRLTDAEWAEAEPAWSPDGTKIAFTSHLIQAGGILCGFMPTVRPGSGGINTEERSSIYVMNADGTEQTRLAATVGGFEPAWSPDGTSLALIINGKGGWQVYAIDVEGTDLTKLTHDTSQKASPTWSLASKRE